MTIPETDLVLLIDGLWSRFQGTPWVLYDMAVKPVATNVAHFLDPFVRSKRENVIGWQEALATIPRVIQRRIRALVSDDLPGLATLAQERGWVHQLCHYHLIAALELKMGWARPRLPTRWLRDEIYRSICEALVTTDEPRLAVLYERLQYLARRWDCRRRLRWIVNQFLRQADRFRAYLRYPELTLPTTTSAMESMHSLLRAAIGSVNNPQSLLNRATAFLRMHPTITCNGKVLTQK